MFKLIRILIHCPLRLAASMLRRKGAVYFVALATFMSLDLLFPQFGGHITTTLLVLGPSFLLILLFLVLARLDLTVKHCMQISTYTIFTGCFGLVRAWSMTIDAGLPQILGGLLRVVIGPVWNLIVAGVTAATGTPHLAPMPIWGDVAVWDRLRALDPLLTISSLLVIATGFHILTYGTRRFGGEAPLTASEKKLRAQQLIPDAHANRVLNGRLSSILHRTKNLFGRPRLKVDQMIVGMARPLWRRPLSWPAAAIGLGLVRLGVRTEGTIFDPRPLIFARFMYGALIQGGSGMGKTLLQIAWLSMSDAPKLTIETQGNAGMKEVPLSRANGRQIHVISPDLGADSASINILAPFDPTSPTFRRDLKAFMRNGLNLRGENPILERCSIQLVDAVTGNTILEGWQQGVMPTMEDVYAHLTDSDLIDTLKVWSTSGHPLFMADCRTLFNRMQDPEFANSMAAIWSPELEFLGDPSQAALLCGYTDQPFDPAILLEDRNHDVTIQISQDELKTSGALLSLLASGVLAPRIALNEEDGMGTPAPGITVWIDEISALGKDMKGTGTPLLDEIVVLHRQRQIRWIYCCQNQQQIDFLWGEGTFRKWSGSANVRIFGKVGGEPETDNYLVEAGGKTLEERIEKTSGPGGGWRAPTIHREETDLISRQFLDDTGLDRAIVFVRTRARVVKMRLDLPAHFYHPALKRFLSDARSRFGWTTSPTTSFGLEEELIAQDETPLALPNDQSLNQLENPVPGE